MVLTADMTPICLQTENSVIEDKNHVKVFLSEFQKDLCSYHKKIFTVSAEKKDSQKV